jgi:tRNA wybutosine-synthesizing protein 3
MVVSFALNISISRFEPFILSVECENLGIASKFLFSALDSGFRESGITCISHRFIVTVRSSNRIEAPIANNGKLLVPMEYIEFLVNLANEKYRANEARIHRFWTNYCKMFELSGPEQDKEEDSTDLSDNKHYSLAVSRHYTKLFKDQLKKLGWLDGAQKINPFVDENKQQATYLVLPLLKTGSSLLRRLLVVGASGNHIYDLEAVSKALKISPESVQGLSSNEIFLVETDVNTTYKSHLTPYDNLRKTLESLLLTHNINARILESVPHKWEVLGDIALLPFKSFFEPEWHSLGGELWKTIASVLRVTRIGIHHEIAVGLKRESQVSVVLGNDGWVIHKENGIIYNFDVTKCMFSRGNITEKVRMGKLCKPGEVIVDFYAGIGYFTLSFLVHGKAGFVHACELNENSITALRKALKLNHIDDSRYAIYPGDNRKSNIAGVADRVNLGLLPSSEDGWGLAVKALKGSGGTIHVHANIKEVDKTFWCKNLVDTFYRLAQETGCEQKKNWKVSSTKTLL